MPKLYMVPAIKRVFDIIDLLATEEGGLTISYMYKTLGLPLSSAATILYTLENLGYVERNGDDSRYKLSMKLLGLSRKLDKLDLVDRCHDILEALVRKSTLTAHLAVERDQQAMYIDRVPAPGLIQFTSYIGMSWPLHSSAVGKALLAFLPPDILRRRLLELRAATKPGKAKRPPAGFEKQLAKFRSLGYTWEMGEEVEGVGCVAAPVFGPGRQVLGAVSVAGTTDQIEKLGIEALGAKVKEKCRLMSERLGGEI